MPKKIIVIDDSSSIRQQVGMVLTTAGYQVVEAQDGLDGLDKIRDHRDAALVLCDIAMPMMNGLDLVEEVLGSKDHARLPIVMLTTEGQAESIARAKRAGAKGWLVKPFDAKLLVATIAKIVGAS